MQVSLIGSLLLSMQPDPETSVIASRKITVNALIFNAFTFKSNPSNLDFGLRRQIHKK